MLNNLITHENVKGKVSQVCVPYWIDAYLISNSQVLKTPNITLLCVKLNKHVLKQEACNCQMVRPDCTAMTITMLLTRPSVQCVGCARWDSEVDTPMTNSYYQFDTAVPITLLQP